MPKGNNKMGFPIAMKIGVFGSYIVWLDMIEQGKVVATPEAGDVEAPWMLAPYSPKILQDTVDLFNALVREIKLRLPGGSTGTGDDLSPCIKEAILDTSNPQRGFAYHFAQKVKRPQFCYIAPGLEIPISSDDTAQPFASLRSDAKDIEILPLLLFRAVDNGASCMAPASGDECPFDYPFNRVDKYPSRLYLSCTSSYKDSFEDESILVLPFRIGAKGYAQKSDGARFGEKPNHADDDVRPIDTFSNVYQPGHQPLTEMHQVRLFCVLENWLGMVQRGDWKVDANGVMGDIDEWKKADTEESWEKYVIPPTW
ncbi:hypothetical protein CC86DRAFT_412683 [Ophiobolus disseminans]|uniref:Uncharacterized protein n=1 Tax=Ophiobolus disseminans TaxID=1469910 RepID=A0A6A6ZF69_9PLEO|nr:hypothetical protein CC86DRAFT_412683 [Ophiobolus disseminans]